MKVKLFDFPKNVFFRLYDSEATFRRVSDASSDLSFVEVERFSPVDGTSRIMRLYCNVYVEVVSGFQQSLF